jgi:hypothetical protein
VVYNSGEVRKEINMRALFFGTILLLQGGLGCLAQDMKIQDMKIQQASPSASITSPKAQADEKYTSREFPFPALDSWCIDNCSQSNLRDIRLTLIEVRRRSDDSVYTLFSLDYKIFNGTHNSAGANNGPDTWLYVSLYDAGGREIKRNAFSVPAGREACRYSDLEKQRHHEGVISDNLIDVARGYSITHSGIGRQGPC